MKYYLKLRKFIDTVSIEIPDVDLSFLIPYQKKYAEIPTENYIPTKKFFKKLHGSDEYPLVYTNSNSKYSFQEFLDKYRKQEIENNITITNERYELNKLLYNNNFTSLDIQQHAETSDLENLIFDTNEFYLSIYLPNNVKINTNIDINKIIKIIKFMKIYGNTKPNIIIFAGKQRKEFPKSYKFLCSENINSGSTYTGKCIYIWRLEEIYRTLVHELFHFHDIHIPTNSLDISKIFNVQGKDVQNESYVECYTILMMIAISSYEKEMSLQNVYNYEMKFTLMQIAKILKFYDFNSVNDLGKKKIIQTTSVFSYYILKGSFLFHLNSFMKYKKNPTDLANLINKTMTNNFYEKINQMMYITIPDGFVNNTSRMTMMA